MATVDQLRPILNGRFTDALNSLLDPANRTGSMRRVADEVGVAYETVRSWSYGETYPKFVEFIALCDAFPSFEKKVRGGISPSAEDKAQAAEENLEQIVAEVDALNKRIQEKLGGNVTRLNVEGKTT